MTTVDVNEVAEKERTVLGYERVDVLPGTTYRDNSTVIIVPSRTPMFHQMVVQSWEGLMSPMNQKKAKVYAIGDEVGVAYNNMVTHILTHPELSKFKYVMTLESDNLPPPDAHIRLLESIELGKFDGVSGIYWTKGEVSMPMAYGNPATYASTGVLEFQPLDISADLKAKRVIEVNGIAMGCSLYRTQLFREVPAPWFVTVNDIIEGKGPMGFTQDLYFCNRARKMGKRFGVDLRVVVGHLDEKTGIVY